MGGMVAAIERGYPQREIQNASYQFARAVDRKEKVIVGVNELVVENPGPVDVLVIDDSAHERQAAKLRALRSERNNQRVDRSLTDLKRAAEGNGNLLPEILERVRGYATLGETVDALREVFGEYREPLFD